MGPEPEEPDRFDRCNGVYSGLGVRPQKAEGKTSRSGALNRTVIALGFTSFFTDISSEMVAAVIPIFLVTQLGFTPSGFGLFQAAQEVANALLRLAGGAIADRTRRPKETAATGYGISTLTRVGLLGSTVSGFTPIPFLLVDRLGKGLRTSPRDAMITFATPKNAWGTAFGVHRTMDAAGALLGPLLAFAILSILPGSFDSVFLLSVGFGLLGFAVITVWVRNPKRLVNAPQRPEGQRLLGQLTQHWVNRGYRRILFLGGAFGVFSIADSFIYLVIFEASREASALSGAIGEVGIGIRWFPLFFAGTAVAFLATATPLGKVADRFGRARVWVGGHVVLLGVYLTLLMGGTSLPAIVLVLGLLGVYYGATDGVLPALAAGVIPVESRSSGLALLATVVASARVLSAFGFGLMWEWVGVDRSLIVMATGLTLVVAVVTAFALFRDPIAEESS